MDALLGRTGGWARCVLLDWPLGGTPGAGGGAAGEGVVGVEVEGGRGGGCSGIGARCTVDIGAHCTPGGPLPSGAGFFFALGMVGRGRLRRCASQLFMARVEVTISRRGPYRNVRAVFIVRCLLELSSAVNSNLGRSIRRSGLAKGVRGWDRSCEAIRSPHWRAESMEQVQGRVGDKIE